VFFIINLYVNLRKSTKVSLFLYLSRLFNGGCTDKRCLCMISRTKINDLNSKTIAALVA